MVLIPDGAFTMGDSVDGLSRCRSRQHDGFSVLHGCDRGDAEPVAGGAAVGYAGGRLHGTCGGQRQGAGSSGAYGELV